MSDFKVQEFMRGSLIEYREDRPFSSGYGKWFRDIVWGYTSDENERDVLELGVNGKLGFIDISSVKGIEITEDLLLDYGFLHIKNLSDASTYFRDDCGYIKLTTYGIEPLYREGKPLRYLHDFQRVFFDHCGKMLNPKITKEPKVEPKLTFQIIKPKTPEQMLKEIQDINSRVASTDKLPEFKF